MLDFIQCQLLGRNVFKLSVTISPHLPPYAFKAKSALFGGVGWLLESLGPNGRNSQWGCVVWSSTLLLMTLLFSQIWKQHFAVMGGWKAHGFKGMSESWTKWKWGSSLFWTLTFLNVLGMMKAMTWANWAAWLKNLIARELHFPKGGLPTTKIILKLVSGW